MKGLRRKILLIFLSLTLGWLILAQVVKKHRISDAKAKDQFEKEGIPIRLSSFQTGGFALHYAQTGKADRPTLVFIHGAPGSWCSFLKYLKDKELLQHFRMVSVDRPGYGFSSFGNRMGLQSQSVLMASFIHSLQNGQPILLIGHSLGGALAVLLAANKTLPVSGLVLLAASVDPAEEKPERWRSLLEAFPLCYFIPGADRTTNAEIRAFKKEIHTVPPALHRITCPVLLLQGTADSNVPPGNACFAQAQLKNATHVRRLLIKNADHFFPWNQFPITKSALIHFYDASIK